MFSSTSRCEEKILTENARTNKAVKGNTAINDYNTLREVIKKWAFKIKFQKLIEYQ